MKPFLHDAQFPLIRAILQVIAPASKSYGFFTEDNRQLPMNDPSIIIEAADVTPWASITFAGHKYRFVLRLEGGAAAIMAAQARIDALLADIEIAVPGHIVADIALVEVALPTGADEQGCRMTFEALTIED